MIRVAQHTIADDFEKLYLELRDKEGRVYTDEEVAMLPEISDTHPHHNEWQIRKQSSHKLVNYLQKKQQPLKLLEVGCGNGWLSYRLASIPDSNVIGTDINLTELQQAAQVFQDKSNVSFIYTDINAGILKEKQFDIIVFAASIQYFPSLTDIVNIALQLLAENGEIHILDSHLYSRSELIGARQRSLLHYSAMGYPEMTKWYFHHILDDLRSFNYAMLYDPGNLFNKLLRHKNPFPWIRIQQ